MNEHLRDRIMRKLSTLPDERLYQLLDYAEFLESRYAERPAQAANVFQRFAETVEDRMRAGRMSAQTVSETMGLMNRAMSVLNGVAAAGASVAKDVKDVVDAATTTPPAHPPGGGGSRPDGTTGAQQVPQQPPPPSATSHMPPPPAPPPPAATDDPAGDSPSRPSS